MYPHRRYVFLKSEQTEWRELTEGLVIIVTIAVGVKDRPASAPMTPGPWSSDWKVVGNPSFAEAIAAVSNLLFSFSGTPGELNFVLNRGFYNRLTSSFRILLNRV